MSPASSAQSAKRWVTHLFQQRETIPLLKVVPPADRRGVQMKAPLERAPRGKYAGGVLERLDMLW